MDAPIRFARTADGLALPYTITGSGFPLVHMPGPWGGLRRSRHDAEWRAAMASRFRYVTYDGRGVGQGPRNIESFTIDDIVNDLLSVIAAAHFRRCILFSGHGLGPAAVQFGAEHRDLVAALISFDSGPPDVFRRPIPSAIVGMANGEPRDWDLLLRHVVSISRHSADDDELSADMDFLRSQTTQRDLAVALRDGASFDVREHVGAVRVPALVLGSRSNYGDHAARMASAIPGARFVRLPHAMTSLDGDQMPPALDAIDAFLAEVLPEALPRDQPTPTPPRHGESLTVSEREVLRLLASGRTNREIAEALVLSPATVSRHVANLYAKLGIHRRAEAVAAAMEHGVTAVAARTT